MKKTYIKPTSWAINIENENAYLLVGSPTDEVGDGGVGGYSKRLDDLDHEDLIDNGIWSKNRW